MKTEIFEILKFFENFEILNFKKKCYEDFDWIIF